MTRIQTVMYENHLIQNIPVITRQAIENINLTAQLINHVLHLQFKSALLKVLKHFPSAAV